MFRKDCGYAVYGHFQEQATAGDVYRHVDQEFPASAGLVLEARPTAPGAPRVRLPRAAHGPLKTWLFHHRLAPAYPLPAPCVYELWVLDGCHE